MVLPRPRHPTAPACPWSRHTVAVPRHLVDIATPSLLTPSPRRLHAVATSPTLLSSRLRTVSTLSPRGRHANAIAVATRSPPRRSSPPHLTPSADGTGRRCAEEAVSRAGDPTLTGAREALHLQPPQLERQRPVAHHRRRTARGHYRRRRSCARGCGGDAVGGRAREAAGRRHWTCSGSPRAGTHAFQHAPAAAATGVATAGRAASGGSAARRGALARPRSVSPTTS
jgi:hypothetical protein